MGVEEIVEASKISRRGFLGVASAFIGGVVTSGCRILPNGSVIFNSNIDINSPEYLAQVRAEIDREVDLSRSLAYIFLDIEKDLGTTQEDYKTVDDLVAKAKERVRVPVKIEDGSFLETDIHKMFSDIGKLLQDEGYKITKTVLFSRGLKTKELDCDLFSVLYATIGEALGLPIQLVNAREHTFVRWVATNGYVNWEATNNTSIPNDFYMVFNGATNESSIKQGVFLKSLTKAEAISLVYSSVGYAYSDNFDYHNSIKSQTKSLFFNTRYVNAYINRGGDLVHLGLLDDAYRDLTKAMQLDPFNYASVNNFGMCIENMGDISGAIKYYEASLLLNPENTVAQENLDRIRNR